MAAMVMAMGRSSHRQDRLMMTPPTSADSTTKGSISSADQSSAEKNGFTFGTTPSPDPTTSPSITSTTTTPTNPTNPPTESTTTTTTTATPSQSQSQSPTPVTSTTALTDITTSTNPEDGETADSDTPPTAIQSTPPTSKAASKRQSVIENYAAPKTKHEVMQMSTEEVEARMEVLRQMYAQHLKTRVRYSPEHYHHVEDMEDDHDDTDSGHTSDTQSKQDDAGSKDGDPNDDRNSTKTRSQSPASGATYRRSGRASKPRKQFVIGETELSVHTMLGVEDTPSASTTSMPMTSASNRGRRSLAAAVDTVVGETSAVMIDNTKQTTSPPSKLSVIAKQLMPTIAPSTPTPTNPTTTTTTTAMVPTMKSATTATSLASTTATSTPTPTPATSTPPTKTTTKPTKTTTTTPTTAEVKSMTAGVTTTTTKQNKKIKLSKRRVSETAVVSTTKTKEVVTSAPPEQPPSTTKMDTSDDGAEHPTEQFPCPWPGCDRIFDRVKSRSAHLKWHGGNYKEEPAMISSSQEQDTELSASVGESVISPPDNKRAAPSKSTQPNKKRSLVACHNVGDTVKLTEAGATRFFSFRGKLGKVEGGGKLDPSVGEICYKISFQSKGRSRTISIPSPLLTTATISETLPEIDTGFSEGDVVLARNHHTYLTRGKIISVNTEDHDDIIYMFRPMGEIEVVPLRLEQIIPDVEIPIQQLKIGDSVATTQTGKSGDHFYFGVVQRLESRRVRINFTEFGVTWRKSSHVRLL